MLGLAFGKAVIIPARAQGHLVTCEAAQAAGCTFDPSGNFEVLRAPVGQDEWAGDYTLKRAGETLGLFHALAGLHNSHAAFTLARYQLGRLSYMLRTTPQAQCASAIRAADLALPLCARAADPAYISGRGRTAPLRGGPE